MYLSLYGATIYSFPSGNGSPRPLLVGLAYVSRGKDRNVLLPKGTVYAIDTRYIQGLLPYLQKDHGGQLQASSEESYATFRDASGISDCEFIDLDLRGRYVKRYLKEDSLRHFGENIIQHKGVEYTRDLTTGIYMPSIFEHFPVLVRIKSRRIDGSVKEYLQGWTPGEIRSRLIHSVFIPYDEEAFPIEKHLWHKTDAEVAVIFDGRSLEGITYQENESPAVSDVEKAGFSSLRELQLEALTEKNIFADLLSGSSATAAAFPAAETQKILPVSERFATDLTRPIIKKGVSPLAKGGSAQAASTDKERRSWISRVVRGMFKR